MGWFFHFHWFSAATYECIVEIIDLAVSVLHSLDSRRKGSCTVSLAIEAAWLATRNSILTFAVSAAPPALVLARLRTCQSESNVCQSNKGNTASCDKCMTACDGVAVEAIVEVMVGIAHATLGNTCGLFGSVVALSGTVYKKVLRSGCENRMRAFAAGRFGTAATGETQNINCQLLDNVCGGCDGYCSRFINIATVATPANSGARPTRMLRAAGISRAKITVQEEFFGVSSRSIVDFRIGCAWKAVGPGGGACGCCAP